MFVVFSLFYLSFVSSADWRKETNFIEYAQVSSNMSTSLLGIQPDRTFRNILRCALECLRTEACGAYVYNSTTGQCQFFTVLFKQSVPGMTPPKLWYFYPGKRGNQWCPVEKGFQLLAADGPCVLFSDDTKTWFEANETICPSYGPGGRLVVLDTQEKNDLLKAAGKSINHIFFTGIHIGLHLTTWVDGTPLTYNYLAFGTLPTNRPCGTIARNIDFHWVDIPCSHVYHYVCELHG